MNNPIKDSNMQLVDAQKLLEILFPAGCRPTMPWLPNTFLSVLRKGRASVKASASG
jgi:hypothetical protein